jgi:pyruvate/2-oxoglutarate dehydrogenase complex dihydrolipoamide acyltransferase (E2) component
MVVAALVAVAPVFPLLRPDIEGIIVMEFAAIGLLRMATLTRTAPAGTGGPASRRFRSGPAVIEATATVIDPSARPAPTPAAPPPSTGPSSGAAARWAGRATGAAAASGKRAASKYGPSAEARVKRTIRSAGRIAGSVTSPPADPADHGD